MDKYYKAFKEIKGNRDIVFEMVLDYFNGRPIDILEIGCARNLDIASRQSDGWSTCFWADYICENGGSLEVFDTSKESIENCDSIIGYWMEGPPFDHIISLNGYPCDFSKYQKGDIKLTFLDGGDDPNQTLNQFEKCKEINIEVILIDDFHKKGKLIKDEPDTLWRWSNGHEMSCFGGPKLGLVNLQLL